MRNPLRLVILFGLVSLFADITYEGARSITGQYLALLGATGAAVGTVAGFGELIGYGLRLASGYISDRTQMYWTITFVGYTINLIAVPLLALAGNWPMAASLIILERLGKAIRSPARDAMLSYATKDIGYGWGFGLHEAMDQIGAVMGPLIVSGVLFYQGSYQSSFLILLIPALCALILLGVARYEFPKPHDLEKESHPLHTTGFHRKFWIYIAAISCVAAGYVDFPLIAFHFEKAESVPEVWIPVFFSIAMAAGGVSALIFGKLYDKKGLLSLIILTALTALFPMLVFLGNFYVCLAGMILWGIGLSAQESVMRAVVAHLVAATKRGTAYGILNTCFGVSWFIGSATMGFLYDLSIPALILFSIAIQWLAIPLLITLNVNEE